MVQRALLNQADYEVTVRTLRRQPAPRLRLTGTSVNVERLNTTEWIFDGGALVGVLATLHPTGIRFETETPHIRTTSNGIRFPCKNQIPNTIMGRRRNS
jgi:hypothetical protein